VSSSETSLPASSAAWDRIEAEEFVQLTTFRRSGEAVRTPVWVVSQGEALLVTTPAASGKVKRLRHTDRVELRPCSRRGTVPDGAPTLAGVATLDTDEGAHARVEHLFAAKYRLQYKAAMVVERVVRAVKRSEGTARFIIRITPA